MRLHAILLALVLGLGGLVSAAAQDMRNPAIEGVISAQIEAFKADDFARAFTFAAPNIRAMFGTAERFGQMVRQGYPMVHRPGRVAFIDLARDGDAMMQRVHIEDSRGQAFVAVYWMVETAQGWQIAAVHIGRAPDLSV